MPDEVIDERFVPEGELDEDVPESELEAEPEHTDIPWESERD